ncbi:MAG: hypothetical protein Q9225_002571 [Loekoesia sp. 1 TL-2023]
MSHGRQLWGFKDGNRKFWSPPIAKPFLPFSSRTVRQIHQAALYRVSPDRLSVQSRDAHRLLPAPFLSSNAIVNSTLRTRSARRMHSYIQFITTPTADTAGTALLLDVGKKRYLFGNIHEGLQRACVQRNARLAKTTEVFVTGKTEWKNIGGLFGVILTLADANASVIRSELENAKKKRTEETPELVAAKAGKKAKLDEERAKVFREAGLDPEEHFGAPEKDGETQVALPTLTIHGGKNLTHTIATGRRFIFRKGMPVEINEHVQNQDHDSADNGRDPDWVDNLIQVWKLSVEPSNGNQSPKIAPEAHRKRVFDEFATGDLPSPRNEEASENLLCSDELRRTVVSEMFNSQWRLDALFETPLSKVRMPALMWIRNKETNKVEPYFPPENGSLPDIEVLVRRPWPGALIDELPPTKPSKAALSYIVRHYPQKGKFLPEKAKALNVHHLVFQALQRGHTVKSQDGTIVTPDMVLEPSRIGGGFAVVDLPSRDYIQNLVTRSEWKMPRVMDGLQAIVWNLGPDVARDPALRSFIGQHDTLKHVMSSPDISPNYLVFDSSSALVIRLNQIDSQRYPIPIHSNVLQSDALASDLSNANLPEPHAAARDLQLQLEPYLKIQAAADTQGYLDTRTVLEVTPKEVLEIAQNVRSDIAAEGLTGSIPGQDLPSQDAEIICLGTGSSAPSKYRNVSATLLRVPGSGNYLFDCGEGTLGQLKRLYAPSHLRGLLRGLKAIWVSHMHADHHLGTTSVIKAWYEANHGRGNTPRGNPRPLDEEPISPIDVLHKGKNLLLFAGHQMIRWLKEYSSVEDFGYNNIVAIRTHSIINNKTSASWMDWNGAQFVRIGQGSTVLVHEATFNDDMQGDAEAKKHSTMSEAIGVAQAMGAKRLILTHFSQRYQKIPSLGALGNINVKYDDPEPASNGAEDISVPDDLEVVGSMNNPNDDFPPQGKPTPPPSKPVHSPQSSPISPANPGELKVAIAFDFLRVRVGDIAHLEKFTPILQRMFEILEKEDKAKAKDHPSEVVRRKKEEEKERKRQEIVKHKEAKEAQKQARKEKTARRERKQSNKEEREVAGGKEDTGNRGEMKEQMDDVGAAERENKGIDDVSRGQDPKTVQVTGDGKMAQNRGGERRPSLPLSQDSELQPANSTGAPP